MVDDSLKVAAGIFVGVVVVLLVLSLIRQQANQQSAQLTSYNVVRDDAGRITSVDTLSGLPLDGHQTTQPGQIEMPPGRQQEPAENRLTN